MATLATQGNQAIILICTEIALLVNQQLAEVPLFDTTAIHPRDACLVYARGLLAPATDPPYFRRPIRRALGLCRLDARVHSRMTC